MNNEESDRSFPKNTQEFQNKKKIKKILFDLTFLFDQYSKRGIGRHSKEVIFRLVPICLQEKEYELGFIGFLDFEQNLTAIGFSPEEKNFLLSSERIKFYSIGKPKVSSVSNIILWLTKYIPVINEFKPDLYFSTNAERGIPTLRFFSKKITKFPYTVVTIYDVIPLMTNTYSSKSFIHNIIKGLFYRYIFDGVKRADKIITISNYSKEQIVKYAKIKEEKISVIYEGVSDDFFLSRYKQDEFEVKEVLENYGLLGEKYFFYDSGLERSKGVFHMLEILKHVWIKNTEGIPKKLVITGSSLNEGEGEEITSNDVLGKNFLDKAKELKILKNIVAVGRVTDGILKILLFNASAHIYLSLNEGFGLGPIQAMAAEVPSIVYNGSCLPEITAGGSLLVNISNYEIASQQIIHFLENDELREKTKYIGLEVAKRYNWDKTVFETWQLIKNLLE